MSIRPARESDLPGLLAIQNHYVTNTHSNFSMRPYTLEDRRVWLTGFAESGPYRLLVAREGDEGDGQVVGFAASGRFMEREAYSSSVMTSVYLDPGHLGKGIGSRLYTALFEALVGEEVHRAYGGIALPNPASIALHERFGFRRVALYTEVGYKFGKYWDVAWYEKVLS